MLASDKKALGSPATGGCPADECDADDACCSAYESCVSCCMSPASGSPTAAERAAMPMPAVGVDGAQTGAAPRTFSDAFDYCAAVCRTHRRSTAHENSYVGARHHCFARAHAVPLTAADPHPQASERAAALSGITVVLGAKGRSCAEACAEPAARQAAVVVGGAEGGEKDVAAAASPAAAKALPPLSCSPEKLALLDDGSCDALRLVSDCEAGCDPSGGQDAEMVLGDAGHRRAARMRAAWPGYVDEAAAKSARPAMCVVNGLKEGQKTSSYDCAAKYRDVLRLCACVAK